MQGYLFVEQSTKVSNSFCEDFEEIVSFVESTNFSWKI